MRFFDLFKKKKVYNVYTDFDKKVDRLPENIDNFRSEHYKVLRRLDKHDINEKFTGLMSLEVDIPKFIPILLKLKLIRYADFKENLECLKVIELKEFLKEYKLKVSGNKLELVERIINNLSKETIKHSSHYKRFYLNTELGKQVVQESYEKLEKEEEEYFRYVIGLILKKELRLAYKVICKRNADKPIYSLNIGKLSFGKDWSEELKNGISDIDYEECMLILRKRISKETVCGVYYYLNEESIQVICNRYKNTFNDNIDEKEFKGKVLYYSYSISNNIEIRNYKECGIEKYVYIATLDLRTCPICRELDDKIFEVKKAKRGVNLPPLHDGCRCTTYAYMGKEWYEGIKRKARDPVTGELYTLPKSMNYKEWYQKFVVEKHK